MKKTAMNTLLNSCRTCQDSEEFINLLQLSFPGQEICKEKLEIVNYQDEVVQSCDTG